jgi:hypothetical protein
LGFEVIMSLTIFCLAGAGDTHKSKTIREFTAKYLKYKRTKGDVLGVFQMPQLHYAVGLNGSGDNVGAVLRGLHFLSRYRGLRVMIVASHTPKSRTFKVVKRFADKNNAAFHPIYTGKHDSEPERNAAIRANLKMIRSLMPGRGR